MLPRIRKPSGIKKTVQLQFGGYDRRPDARDGTFRETDGMTQREFPVMATGAGWMRKAEDEKSWERCLCSMGDGLLWVQEGYAYYNGIYLGAMLEQSSERLVPFGSKAIFPRTREMIDLSYPPKGRKDSQAELPASALEGEAWLIRQDSEDFWSPSEIWVRQNGAWVNLGPIIRPLEVRKTLPTAVFRSGTYVGEKAVNNTIEYIGGDEMSGDSFDFGKYFQAGDAVTINGWAEEFNQTLILREVTPKELHFYEYSFPNMVGRYTLQEELGPGLYMVQDWDRFEIDQANDNAPKKFFILPTGHALAAGMRIEYRYQESQYNPMSWHHNEAKIKVFAGDGSEYTGVTLTPLSDYDPEQYPGDPTMLQFEPVDCGEPMVYAQTGLKLSKTWPEKLEGVFADSNRLWGWEGRTLRASKLGDPSNWKFFDGTAEDSWAVDLQWPETITGGISAHGYPTFYTERRRVRVYGTTPEAFQTSELDCIGVRAGCGKSLALVDGVLYYVSREGVMRDDGTTPTLISAAFGPLRLEEAVGGGLGTLLLMAGRDADGGRHLFSYDTRSGVWIRESGEYLTDIAAAGGLLFAAALWEAPPYGWFSELRCLGAAPGWGDWTEAGDGAFLLETNDYTMAQPNTKRVHRVQIRMLLEEETRVAVSIQYDESGSWIPAARLLGDGQRRSVYLPILPRRCDRFRLRFEGAGAWRLESLALELRSGSPELAPGPRFTD